MLDWSVEEPIQKKAEARSVRKCLRLAGVNAAA